MRLCLLTGALLATSVHAVSAQQVLTPPTTNYTFAWDAPTGPEPVTRYEWQVQPGPAYASVGLSTSVQMPALANGTYSAFVRACNAAGCGGSTSLSLTVGTTPPPAPPGATSNLRITLTSASPAVAVPTIVPSVRNHGTSIARSITPTASGSLLVAMAAWYTSAGSADPTVVGSANGAYTKAFTIGGDANSRIGVWYKLNAAATSDTVTLNPPGSTSDNDLTLIEVTGIVTTAAVDKILTNTGTSAAASVASGALAQGKELLIAGMSHTAGNIVLTPDNVGGYTQLDENHTNTGGQAFNWQVKIVNSATSDVADWTLGNNATWVAGLVSFKAVP